MHALQSSNARQLLTEACLRHAQGENVVASLQSYSSDALDEAIGLLRQVSENPPPIPTDTNHAALSRYLTDMLDHIYVSSEVGFGDTVTPEMTYKSSGDKGGDQGVTQRHPNNKTLHYYENGGEFAPSIRMELTRAGWCSPAVISRHIQDKDGYPVDHLLVAELIRRISPLIRCQKIEELAAGPMRRESDPRKAAEEWVQNHYIYNERCGHANHQINYYLYAPEALKSLSTWLATVNPPTRMKPLGDWVSQTDMVKRLSTAGVHNAGGKLAIIFSEVNAYLTDIGIEPAKAEALVSQCKEKRLCSDRARLGYSPEAAALIEKYLSDTSNQDTKSKKLCKETAHALCEMLLAQEPKSSPLAKEHESWLQRGRARKAAEANHLQI